MKRCFIFSAGSFYGIKTKPENDDIIIAADAGYKYCFNENIKPDLILGDFDSSDVPQNFSNLLFFPVEKDDTDTMLAVKEGLKRGCTEFFIYGGTGGERLDHTFANIQTLIYLADHNAHGFLFDKNFIFTAIKNESITIEKTVENGIISNFCFGENAKGVTLTGVQYPLLNAELSTGFPLGVGNHFAEDKATVTVKNGTLVVGWQVQDSDM